MKREIEAFNRWVDGLGEAMARALEVALGLPRGSVVFGSDDEDVTEIVDDGGAR